MKTKLGKIIFLTALTAAVLTGCGSAGDVLMESAYEEKGKVAAGAYANELALEEYPVEEAAEVAMPEEFEAETTDQTELENAAQQEETIAKKLIRNVDLEVETQDFDALLANITGEVERLGGYLEECSTSRYSVYDTWTGSITARIPSERLDDFLSKVAESSNVVFRNESVQDVTLQYVDLDAHKKALMTERDRLMELMEKAETVEDLIAIESRLSEVRYQIESMEERLRTIDHQVSYSTVYIEVREVELLTVAADKTAWEEITEGFGNNVYRVLHGLSSFFIGVIIDIPFILMWIVIIAVLVLIVRLLQGYRCRRKQKKLEKRRKQQLEADYEEIPAAGSQKTEQKKDRD